MKKIISIILILSMLTAFEFVSYGNDNSDDIKSMLESGGKITLTKDYQINEKVIVSGDVVLDLNGHELSCDSKGHILQSGGNLYIKDSAKSTYDETAGKLNLMVEGGRCFIYGGNYGIVEVFNDAECHIDGGNFAGQEGWVYYYPSEFKTALIVAGGKCNIYNADVKARIEIYGSQIPITEDSEKGYLNIYDINLKGDIFERNGGVLKIYDGEFEGYLPYDRQTNDALKIFGGNAEIYGGTFGVFGNINDSDNPGCALRIENDYIKDNENTYLDRVTIYGGNFAGGWCPEENSPYWADLETGGAWMYSAITIIADKDIELNDFFSCEGECIRGDKNGLSLNLMDTSEWDEGWHDVNIYTLTDYPNTFSFTLPDDIIIESKQMPAVPEKLNQYISAEDVTAVYGNENLRISAENTGDGAVSYTVKEGYEEYIDVDSETGALVIKKAGTAYVTAAAEATSMYNEAVREIKVDIVPKEIIIKADNKTAYAGSTAPELGESDYTVTGLLERDRLIENPVIAYESEPDMSKSGTVNIIVSGAYAGGNYTIKYINGTLSVVNKSSGGSGGGRAAAVPESEFNISVDKPENGSISVDKTSAKEGEKITVNVSADKDYELESIIIKDKNGKTVSSTEKDGKYSFAMPASDVKIAAAFRKKTTEVKTVPFNDIEENNWYYDSVEYVYSRGMMKGMDDSHFGPSETTTRGMIITILYRMEGEPSVSGNAFADVKSDMYYAAAINWAVENGIVKGYGDGIFGPEDSITREQLSNILMNYAEYKGADVTARADLSNFCDALQASSWAEASLAWANAEGLIQGNPDSTINPGGNAERAQAAAILARFDKKIK